MQCVTVFGKHTTLFDENYLKSRKGIGNGCNYQITEAVGESRIDGVQRSLLNSAVGLNVWKQGIGSLGCARCHRATIPLPHPLLCHTVLLPTLPPAAATPAPTRSLARQTTCVLLINLRHNRSFYRVSPYYQSKWANERAPGFTNFPI